MFSLVTSLLVFVSIFGLTFMVIGWRTYLTAVERLNSWQRTSGVVVEILTVYRADTDISADATFAPVVEYQTNDARKPIRFQDQLASSPASHKVGDIVEVLFNPFDPSEACIFGEMRVFAPAAIFFGVGATFFLFAVVYKFN
jgi:hypothetical protein